MALTSFCGLLSLQVGGTILAGVFFTLAGVIVVANVFDYHNDFEWFPYSLILMLIFVIGLVIAGILMFASSYNENISLAIISVIVIIILICYWLILCAFSFLSDPDHVSGVCIGTRCPETFWIGSLDYRRHLEEESEKQVAYRTSGMRVYNQPETRADKDGREKRMEPSISLPLNYTPENENQGILGKEKNTDLISNLYYQRYHFDQEKREYGAYPAKEERTAIKKQQKRKERSVYEYLKNLLMTEDKTGIKLRLPYMKHKNIDKSKPCENQGETEQEQKPMRRFEEEIKTNQGYVENIEELDSRNIYSTENISTNGISNNFQKYMLLKEPESQNPLLPTKISEHKIPNLKKIGTATGSTNLWLGYQAYITYLKDEEEGGEGEKLWDNRYIKKNTSLSVDRRRQLRLDDLTREEKLWRKTSTRKYHSGSTSENTTNTPGNKEDAEENTEQPSRYIFGYAMIGAIIVFITNLLFLLFSALVMYSWAQELNLDDYYYYYDDDYD